MTKATTIGEVSMLWRDDKRKYVKYSTYSAYNLILENHILPSLGERTQIDEQDAQDFALRKLHSGMSQKSVRDILMVLKMVMRFGDRIGAWAYNGWKINFPPTDSVPGIDALTVRDHRKILCYLRENQSLRNLGIYLSLTTGMRIGEICALRWDDIDMVSGVIKVQRTIERIYTIENGCRRTELIIGPPKTQHSRREIPVTRELMSMLRHLCPTESAGRYIITGTGKPTEPRTYRNHYNRILARLGIPHIRFHGLRHSFATRCIESECDYKTVSVILGHSDIRTTLNMYVHPNMEQKRKCLDKMCGFMQ